MYVCVYIYIYTHNTDHDDDSRRALLPEVSNDSSLRRRNRIVHKVGKRFMCRCFGM